MKDLQEYHKKRSFQKTPEPRGGKKSHQGKPYFVIQKHDATRLHYDLRLELHGVMKSWAVPKGPSLNPDEKRLAMMTEDHPLEYRNFEGVIPENNYGAGPVIIWDKGTYTSAHSEKPKKIEEEIEEGLKKGHLSFILSGHKTKGRFDLIKTKGRDERAWLLVKKEDAFSSPEDLTLQDRSVISGKNLQDLTAPTTKLPDLSIHPRGKPKTPIMPMKAVLGSEAFDHEDWIYEIKWDGYRAIADTSQENLAFYSRNQKSFFDQYPLISSELKKCSFKAILDGEVVAVDEQGIPSFQELQNAQQTSHTLIYYVFDLLYLEGHNLLSLPLIKRKELLQQILPQSSCIRHTDHIEEKGRKFFEQLKKTGIEGMIAKHKNSQYLPGKRSSQWIKVKWVHEEEAIIGGYTAPRKSRKHFGALLLGQFEDKHLKYIGHTGTGFNEKSLKELKEKMDQYQKKMSPFSKPPKPNEPVTWLKPKLICQVKFTEWTKEGHMRHPVFMGLREDKEPEEVTGEKAISTVGRERIVGTEGTEGTEGITDRGNIETLTQMENSPLPVIRSSGGPPLTVRPRAHGREARGRGSGLRLRVSASSSGPRGGHSDSRRRERSRKESEVRSGSEEEIARGLGVESQPQLLKPASSLQKENISISNPNKIYWPEEGYSKQDLINYYDEIADVMVPYLKDHPQTLLRHPNGITGKHFFQKNVSGLKTEHLETIKVPLEDGTLKELLLCQNRKTLLYMINLGCIEINPWLARKDHLNYPDFCVIDLDPEDIDFEAVREAALVLYEILKKALIPSAIKTSGKRGLHIAIPLGAQYTYDQSRYFGELLAELTHLRAPSFTSLARMPKERQKKVYIDFLQNRKDQSIVAPYSVRPVPEATVSAPLSWKEVKNKKTVPSLFTMMNMKERTDQMGDLWKTVMKEGIDLAKVLKRLEKIDS